MQAFADPNDLTARSFVLFDHRMRFSLRLLVGASLAALLVYLVGVEAVLDRLAVLPAWFIAFGLAYYAVCQLISTLRWQVLLRARGAELGFWHLFKLYMIGMFANNFLPGAAGGDAVKVLGLYGARRPGDLAVASVLVERFLGLAALGFIGLIASAPLLLQKTGDPVILLATVGTAAAITAVGVVVWSPPVSGRIARALENTRASRIGDIIYKIFEATRLYWEHKHALLAAFGLSIAVQAMIAIYYALAATVLGVDVHPIYFFAFLPSITLVSILPMSIGGLGVRELVMIYLFSRVGVDSADILTVGLVIHALNTLLSLAGAPLMLRMRRHKENADHSPDSWT